MCAAGLKDDPALPTPRPQYPLEAEHRLDDCTLVRELDLQLGLRAREIVSEVAKRLR